MNRNRLLLIGVIALALGTLVSYAVYQNLRSKATADTRPGVDVVVAADNLGVGDKIAINDVRLVRLPEDTVPADHFSRTSEVLGRGVVVRITKGDFLLPGKLADTNAGSGLSGLIPTGMRAVSVRVNEVVSVAGYVQPGTRVDVLVTGTSGGGEQQTTTVLENVLVLAAGDKLERDANGRAQTTPVITLAVSPDDAQKLTLASTEGRIQLALRNPTDTKQMDLNAVGTGTLYRRAAAPVTTSRPRTKRTSETPPPPTVYSVEVYRGDKRDETKFPEQPK